MTATPTSIGAIPRSTAMEPASTRPGRQCMDFPPQRRLSSRQMAWSYSRVEGERMANNRSTMRFQTPETGAELFGNWQITYRGAYALILPEISQMPRDVSRAPRSIRWKRSAGADPVGAAEGDGAQANVGALRRWRAWLRKWRSAAFLRLTERRDRASEAERPSALTLLDRTLPVRS